MISYNINSLVAECEDVKLLKPPLFVWGEDSIPSVCTSFKENSFVVLRNFVENSVVEAIREDLLEEMVKMDLVNRDWSLKKAQGICFTGFEPLTNTPSFKKLASDIQKSSLLSLLQPHYNTQQHQLLDTKYVRCLGRLQEVSLHCDSFRFNQSSIITVWIALTPLNIRNGTLVLKSQPFTPEELTKQMEGSQIPLAFVEQVEKGTAWYYTPLTPGDVVFLLPSILYGTFRNDSPLASAHMELRWIKNSSLETTSSH